MGFCTVWASAASTTSRGVLVRSAAQSRKLDRNPCGSHLRDAATRPESRPVSLRNRVSPGRWEKILAGTSPGVRAGDRALSDAGDRPGLIIGASSLT